jgi:hypothetical protein
MNKRAFGAPLFFLFWSIVSILLFAPRSFAQVVELKPEIQAFPAYDLTVTTDTLGNKKLIFSTRTWNSGDGPLELHAGETGSAGQNVYQRIYLSDGGYYDRLAGTFVWHPEHSHFHFDDYALYTLQPRNAPGGSKRTGSKTTFCIMDTDPINTSLPGAPQQAVYASCGATAQGMSIGWGDTYGSHLAGQSIDITGLPDGDYALTIEADPKNRLLEITEDNNTSCALIRLSVANATVRVLEPPNCSSNGEVMVSSILPNTAKRGSVTSVTITGSGFAASMTVSFENGSGPRPTASNVTVLDANTIKATVTVKKGKVGNDPVWDVRVGSGVLLSGFTVLP